MITKISDYSETNEFYRIPAPIGAGDTAELTGLINFAEMRFTRTFGSVDFSIPSNMEALKYFVFSQWCSAVPIKKTPVAPSAKPRYNQAENVYDVERFSKAYNTACDLMDRKDFRLIQNFNF